MQVYGSPLGFSTYHVLQVVLNREYSNGLTLYTNYVWSHTMSNVESSLINGNDPRPLDYYNLRPEKFVAQFDRPHMFKTASYDIPMGAAREHSQHANGGERDPRRLEPRGDPQLPTAESRSSSPAAARTAAGTAPSTG